MNQNDYEFVPENSVEGFADLQLVGTLSYLGFSVSHIDASRPKAVFYFQKTPELLDAVDKYWSGELQVEPKRFAGVIRDLKARLYNAVV